MNSDFRLHVLSVIERYEMLSPGDTVIVGLSGGADSMALLTVLNDIKSEYDLTLIAAHVNHGLRGDEALRDERFAGDFCKSLGIEYRVLHADVSGMAAESGESFEACGRRVRYDFFANIAKEVVVTGENGDDAMAKIKVATAHNAQDVAETLIFNLARGSSLHGLCSIPPTRVHERDDICIEIVRPLINSTRDEIEEYLAEKEISYVNDSTNSDIDYARNRIRHNILPELEKINPGVIKNISRCTEMLRADDAYFSSESLYVACKAYDNGDYNVNILKQQPYSVRSRTIARIIYEESGVQPEKRHIDTVCYLIDAGFGITQIPGGLYVLVKNGKLTLSSKPENFTETEDFALEICLKTSRYTDNLFGAEVSFSVCSKEEFFEAVEKDKRILETALDYDKIPSNFLVRNRRDGDRFRLPKRHITKSLKNLFNEAKIPTAQRSRLLMIEVDGEIAFLENFGPSEKYIVTEDTEKVLTIEIVRGNEK